MNNYKGTLECLLDGFLDNKLMYAPFNSHILEFWKLSKVHSNILYLFYEDMKADLDAEVKRTMRFLGKEFTQEDVDKLCDHLSVDSMRKNPSCNFEGALKMMKIHYGNQDDEDFQFIRKAKVGSGKEEMSEEYYRKFEALKNDPELAKHGFVFK
jgi:Sulfotransferase domain